MLQFRSILCRGWWNIRRCFSDSHNRDSTILFAQRFA